MNQRRWQFSIDRGGTFTDVVGRSPDGTLETLKLLSDSEHYRDPALEGMRRMLKMEVGEPIGADRVEAVRMGTTIATNALLERRGARTVLVITRGFRDALRIGNQARPRIFDRCIAIPPAVYEQVIEASERVSADGTVIEPLDEPALAVALRRAFAEGLRACAIVFLHGYRQSAHEDRAAALAREAGFSQVSVSNRVSSLMKLVPRGDTTVTDAYLSPVVRRYVEELRVQMPGVRLLFMQSSGGLTDASRFHGKDAVLSGPAGGIVGMVASAQSAGYDRLIGFDMGGTSTDVSHYAGCYERVLDTDIGGVRLSVPMMNIHTIAAGGGSVIRFDGTRLRVGPSSAGSNPGPASYRRGGPLTITDANILLGRIRVEHFPRVFGARGDAPLDRDVVERGFADLATSVAANCGMGVSAEDIAAGGVRIAVANMVNAIKKISIARGHPVTRYTLQCFGGAGGQHACLVADALGIERIFCHPLAGVLSAYGIGMAEQSVIRTASLERSLDAAGFAAAWSLAASLEADARTELALTDSGAALVIFERQVHVRYAGTDTALPCRLPAPQSGEDDCQSIRTDFEAGYRRRFSFLLPHAELILEAVAVECMVSKTEGADSSPASTARDDAPADPISAGVEISMYCFADATAAGWRTGQLVHRNRMQTGVLLQGPAVIVERNGTTVLEPGWQAVRSAAGNLELTRTTDTATTRRWSSVRADPVMLEIFNNLFMSIAEQMGLRFQSAAHSVNIKERLDFSCALFDAKGSLIANAPHMPVHLGSMGESILAVIGRHPKMQAGDAFVLNDPYHGGTHLPDLTVVTPVFMTGTSPDFFVASRGHHADIGGISPGSMPPFSTHIAEEGVLLDNFKMMEGGVLREQALTEFLQSGAHPARNVAQNLADLRAQVAANETGAQELRTLVAAYGLATVVAYMRHVQDNAEECVRRAIAGLRGGRFAIRLDNGAVIRVEVRVDAPSRTAQVDFTGTTAQSRDNFNAPRAITVAAVLYVFRTLVDDDIPLNAGCLKPLEIIVPAGSLLNPSWPAAVVAGNVETSMCITNALYGALGVMASSQCTMNNFTFGNAQYQYYETIAGGSGAGPGFAGTDVIQSHMTNSRMTDPEVLESRYPVRVESFQIRSGSAGLGRWRGGEGGIRRIRFLEAMTAAILSNGRRSGAFGMAGGDAGAPGVNSVERVDGSIEALGAAAEVAMAAGDIFTIATPGGGGYGKCDPTRESPVV